MGNVKNLHDDFLTIFNSAQLSTGSHQKSALILKRLYNLVDSELFFQTFLKFANTVILVDSEIKCPYVERIMDFIGFCCLTLKQVLDSTDGREDDAVEHPFLDKYFAFLLHVQNVDNVSIRIRTCQLINKILDHLINTDLCTQFCDNIEKAMLERLNDPKLEVRLEGIQALHRFQEIENPLDEIIDVFKVLLENDRYAKVRRLCVAKIALRKDVIPLIISKLRDVDIQVRLAAFTRLIKIPRSMKIEQRRLVLLSASLDTSDKIKSYVEVTLIPAWLLHFGENYHDFMKAIRLDANESDVKTTTSLCEFILKTLFKLKSIDVLVKEIGLDDNKLIPIKNLNWETSNYWRILLQYIKNSLNMEDQVEEILPELVHFCDYINKFCNNLPEVKSTTDFLENQFILNQLFTIVKLYDVSDPIGRHALLNLIQKVLSEVVLTLDTAEVIMKNLEPIFPQVELRARYVNELISEIIYHESEEDNIDKQLVLQEKVKTLKNDLAVTSMMQDSAIAQKDYLLAEELEKNICHLNSMMSEILKEEYNQTQQAPVKKTDKATLVKCLDIAAGLLLSPGVTRITSSLETLKKETIFELMIHENETVQAKAMHCYALLCLIDKKTANHGIHLFYAPISAYQAGQECDIQVLLICMKSIVDLLRIFGTQLVAAPEERIDLSESQREDHQRHFFGGTSLTNIIKGLVDLMDDEQIQVQETACRGLCSLVLDNIVQSSSLLSRLVLKWCNPYDQCQKLKQCIGITFQQLPSISGFHRQWEGTILLTLKVLIYAPEESPYCDTNVDDIAKFLVALFEINMEDEVVLYNFAMRVCLEIRKKPKSKLVPTLAKVLNMLHVTTDNPVIEELLAICDELQDVIHSYSTISQLTKFMEKLNKIRKYEFPRTIRSDDSDDGSENQMQSNDMQAIEEEEED